MTIRKAIGLLAITLTGLVSVGCGGGPRMGRYNVEVTLGEGVGTGGGTTEVDVIGVNAAEHDRWAGQDMNTYPSSQLRADAPKHRLTLTSASPSAEFSRNAPEWDSWKGAETLFILTDLPVAGAGGPADPRRLMLPLDQARWSGSTIRVRVDRSGLKLLTEMVPEKKK